MMDGLNGFDRWIGCLCIFQYVVSEYGRLELYHESKLFQIQDILTGKDYVIAQLFHNFLLF